VPVLGCMPGIGCQTRMVIVWPADVAPVLPDRWPPGRRRGRRGRQPIEGSDVDGPVGVGPPVGVDMRPGVGVVRGLAVWVIVIVTRRVVMVEQGVTDDRPECIDIERGPAGLRGGIEVHVPVLAVGVLVHVQPDARRRAQQRERGDDEPPPDHAGCPPALRHGRSLTTGRIRESRR